MAFCNQPWAVEMPARTKAQRAAKLARAREEKRLHYKLWHLIGGMADREWERYKDAQEICRQMEKPRA